MSIPCTGIGALTVFNSYKKLVNNPQRDQANQLKISAEDFLFFWGGRNAEIFVCQKAVAYHWLILDEYARSER